MSRLLIVILCFCHGICLPQEESLLQWRNPEQSDINILEGQAWPGEVADPYDRLPQSARANVRDAVWKLSKNSAGLKIRFRSNATEIVVRYVVQSGYEHNHMPATGVSGVDMYAKDSEGKWLWCRGSRSFKDTITYRFKGLRPNDRFHDLGREYRLNFPLYNSVKWMEIGVEKSTYFEFLPARKDKPIVVYGTSIAQGACASRPGMAWTNILSRYMDRPLINLAFSGNGRLEKELIDLLSKIEAKLYILDCLPNLMQSELYDDKELENRIMNSVNQLKKARPGTPILLTDHAGYTDGLIQPGRQEQYTRVNTIQKAVFDKLISDGISKLYYLSYDEIGLELDDMVDGTHPNDLGMMRYARAYEKKLRSILKEPQGEISTTKPVTQSREPQVYSWEDRHNKILEINKTSPPKILILANSIIQFWGGLPRTKIVREEDTWKNHLTPLGVRNYAYGWDRIENVLWRIYHGELDGFKAEKIMVMIGTNNLHLNTDEEIIKGLKSLMEAIKMRQPTADLVLMGILPRRAKEERVADLNGQIALLAKELGIKYADLGGAFLNGDSKIRENLFSDGLHPNRDGYLKLKEGLLPLLDDL